MHLSSTVVLLATALGAAAHPSLAVPAGHRHAQFHRAVQARSDKFVKHIPATPAPESTPSEEPAAPSGGKLEFCSGNSKRATGYDISYKGNTGAAGNWGCNIMVVDCSTIDLYDYAAEFSSTGSDFSCSAFNKIGPTDLIDGFWHSALDFAVTGAEKVCLAFDTNSQGGVACGAGTNGPPKTSIGQLAGTWCEFDYGSGKNGGQSGADVSVIVADVNNMNDIIPMSIDAPGKGTCSKLSLADPGSSFEVYRGGMEDLDGVGCKGYSTGSITVVLGD